MDAVLAAVNLTGVSDFATNIGTLIVGIAMAFKAITLAKRAISKA